MVVTREAPSIDTILPSTGNLSEYNEGLVCDRPRSRESIQLIAREKTSFLSCTTR